ncbi:stage V sporulation protein B [Cytobacillus sp. FSL R7-0696]|uniref:stage V sporulation protein B n=1 Tax=Cytobacillus sp. FSL R7-0696 TaxID=2921691 RepID=UPI0030F4F775
MSKFIQGTIILLFAGLVTRVLGFINRIVIARFIGAEGVGLYMMAFPTFILVVTITQLGLPVAISKNVAEAEARGDTEKTKKILIVSLASTLSLSLLFTPALILLTPYLSEHLLTDNRTLYPLLAIAPVVPIIAVSSVIRGYFQGKQNMKPAAYSQLIEQVVRITLIAALTKAFLPYGIEYAAAGAMLASVIGELASLIYLLTSFKLKKKFKVRKQFFQHIRKGKDTFKQLMEVALPTTGSRMIGSVAWFLEPIVVTYSLTIAGVSTIAATEGYGALTGFALPLLMLPSFINMALSTSLVPAISEAKAVNNIHLIEYRLQQALRISLTTGGLSVVVIYILAEPLMTVMYGSTTGTDFLKLMAPLFLFYYFQQPLQSALQALDLARAAMINSLIGAVAKIAVIFILGSQPAFGITGVALGLIVGFVLVTLLHFATLLKAISYTIHMREYLITSGAMLLTGYIGYITIKFLNFTIVPTILCGAVVMSLIYLIIMIFTKLIRKGDVQGLPGVGQFLAKFMFR